MIDLQPFVDSINSMSKGMQPLIDSMVNMGRAVGRTYQVGVLIHQAIEEYIVELDKWLDEAEKEVAEYAGLDPERVSCSTDYCSAWSVRYDGELTLIQTHWIAKWMMAVEGVSSLMPGIYDNSINIYSEAVREMARNVATTEEPPKIQTGPTWHERLVRAN